MYRAQSMLESIINFFLLLVESLLGLRFLFRFFGANTDNGFVQWLYDNTAELLSPFRGIFIDPLLEGRYVVEFTTLFAMFVYALVAFLALALVNMLTPDPMPAVASKSTRRR